jgi:hypothetical protein
VPIVSKHIRPDSSLLQGFMGRKYSRLPASHYSTERMHTSHNPESMRRVFEREFGTCDRKCSLHPILPTHNQRSVGSSGGGSRVQGTVIYDGEFTNDV